MDQLREGQSGLSALCIQPTPGTICSSVLQPLLPLRATQNLCSVPDLLSCEVSLSLHSPQQRLTSLNFCYS